MAGDPILPPIHPIGCRCMCCSHGFEYSQYQFTPIPAAWTCPRCGSIYGPAALECSRCNPPHKVEITS